MLGEEELIEAVTRYFDRKYSGKTRMFYPEATKQIGEKIDLLFVQSRKDCIHLIEAEPDINRIWDDKTPHGFAQLIRHRGNYRWLAISKEVYEDGMRKIREECKR